MFGLSFYTVPKITPLGYVSCFYGSWATAIAYATLSFFVLPPPRLAESALGMLYCAPAIWVFTTIAYYAEYNSRERFVLRRRLRSESITLAVACTPSASSFISSHRVFTTGGSAGSASTAPATDLTLADRLVRALSLSSFNTGWITNHRTASYLVALGLWAAFTLGGWTSLPDGLKFVDQDTGWAWFSHCAGVTVFLLVMTRRLLWLMIVPLGGAFILWMLTLTMPASWIIISAHSVGYGLLLASVVIAMGVFSWFMCAWNELVAFLTRTCFLFPQLQAGMETDFPLLVKIVSEYTANFDPQILSSRRASPPVPVAPPLDAAKQDVSSDNKRKSKSDEANAIVAQKSHSGGQPMSNSRRRRASTAVHESKARSSDDAEVASHANKTAASSATSEPLASGKCDHDRQREESPSSDKSAASSSSSLLSPSLSALKSDHLVANHDERIVSVLPSFSPGKCFFCSKNAAEHYVPACGMWGKWTYWRMSQQHPGLSSSNLSILPSATSATPSNKHAVAMCTSYYDLQHRNAELEARIDALETENRALAQQQKKSTQEFERELAHVQQELHSLQEKHAQEKLRLETQHRDKLADVLRESNRAAREHKLEVKKVEAAGALALAEAQNQARRDQEVANAQIKEAQQQVNELETTKAQLKEVKRQVAELMEAEKHRQHRRRAVSDSSDAHSCDGDAATSSFTTKMRFQRSPLALDASFTSATSNEFDDDDCDTSSSPKARQSPVAIANSLVALQPSGRLPYAKSLEIEGMRESVGESQRDVDYAARWRDWQQAPSKR